MCRRYGLESGFKKGPLYGIRFLDSRSGLRGDCYDSVTPLTNPNQNRLGLALTVTERDAPANITGSDNLLANSQRALPRSPSKRSFMGSPVWTIETVDVNPEKYLAQTKQADLV